MNSSPLSRRLKRFVPQVAVLALASLFLLPSVGSGKALEEEIEIVDSSDMDSWGYDPASLTVPVGTTVSWKNSGREVHGVTSRDQLFDSKLLDSGKSWSHTFDTPGTYRYFCVPHPWMKGVVVVVSPDETPSRSGSGSGQGSSSDESPSRSGTGSNQGTGGSSGSGSSGLAGQGSGSTSSSDR